MGAFRALYEQRHLCERARKGERERESEILAPVRRGNRLSPFAGLSPRAATSFKRNWEGYTPNSLGSSVFLGGAGVLGLSLKRWGTGLLCFFQGNPKTVAPGGGNR